MFVSTPSEGRRRKRNNFQVAIRDPWNVTLQSYGSYLLETHRGHIYGWIGQPPESKKAIHGDDGEGEGRHGEEGENHLGLTGCEL